MSIGYIYVLSNAAIPGLLKIGYTTRDDIGERVRELSSATGVPAPFEIEYYCLTRQVEEVEEKAHIHFSSRRMKDKEFFSVDLFEAVRVLDGLVDEDIKPDRYLKGSIEEDSKWHCEQCHYKWIAPGVIWCPNCRGNRVTRDRS